jgi:hypothetical protein
MVFGIRKLIQTDQSKQSKPIQYENYYHTVSTVFNSFFLKSARVWPNKINYNMLLLMVTL